MFDDEVFPLARKLSALLCGDFHAVADSMAHLTEEQKPRVTCWDLVPAKRFGFIDCVISKLDEFDSEKQEDWAAVSADQLEPVVSDHLNSMVTDFVNDYDLALNYIDYSCGARRSFGHDFYAAGCSLIELLDELKPITLAEVYEAWWDNDRRRMLTLMRCDLMLFEKAREFRSVLHYREFS